MIYTAKYAHTNHYLMLVDINVVMLLFKKHALLPCPYCKPSVCLMLASMQGKGACFFAKSGEEIGGWCSELVVCSCTQIYCVILSKLVFLFTIIYKRLVKVIAT